MEFETSLASLPSTKSIYSATPEDVSRFLVWKDRHGKRVIHFAGCVRAPNQDASDCGCPNRLAFKTVNSYVGKLRAIFNEAGRSGDWNSLLGFGNPTASSPVQSYLQSQVIFSQPFRSLYSRPRSSILQNSFLQRG